mgnify:CR=1 FL=1
MGERKLETARTRGKRTKRAVRSAVRSAAVLIAVLLLAAGCGGEKGGGQTPEQTGLRDITVVLEWTPNTNHTGIYAARALGYFEEAGLDVSIVLPGDAGSTQLVAAGSAQFGVSTQESVMMARTQEVPVVSVAAILQHNTSGFAAPAERGIRSPKDFEGKTYGGWGDPLERAILETVMSKAGGDPSKLRMVNIGTSDYFTAVSRDIDFAWIFYGWTGIEAELRNMPLDMIYLKDMAPELDWYTPVLITSEKLIAEQPETVKAFLAAVSRGYEYAINHPEEAADLLLEAEPDLDAELVRNSQKWLADQYRADAPRWGEQKREVWDSFGSWLMDNGLLEREVDIDRAFTNDFLPKG